METPRYPHSRGIVLEDKTDLDPLFDALQPRVSELSFANLFLFRKVHDYRLTRVGAAVVILGRGYDGASYFLPPLGGDVREAALELLTAGLTLYGADDPFVERYLPAEVELVPDRDNFDYLHLKREMAALEGNKYHKKKNRVNYFVSRHSHETDLYSERHLDGALALLEEWRRVRMEHAPSASIQEETKGAAEALRLHKELGLSGVVLLVGGVVKGFALGERLNRDTAVCHFEKGDLFMDGLYQLLDREFSRLLFTECSYLNREQDLGEPSLRKAKLSYHPVGMVVKYRVTLPPSRTG